LCGGVSFRIPVLWRTGGGRWRWRVLRSGSDSGGADIRARNRYRRHGICGQWPVCIEASLAVRSAGPAHQFVYYDRSTCITEHVAFLIQIDRTSSPSPNPWRLFAPLICVANVPRGPLGHLSARGDSSHQRVEFACGCILRVAAKIGFSSELKIHSFFGNSRRVGAGTFPAPHFAK